LLSGTGPTLLIDSEVVPYKTAALVSEGVYTITGLLRGRRGTEWAAIIDKPIGTRVVLLRMAGMRRVQMQAGELNLNRYYKGITLGRALSSAVSETFTNTGIGLKPFAVRNVRGVRAVGGDLTITWDRRTRLSENWLLGVLPLGETVESYSIDIMNGSTVVRTISSSTASTIYTAAQQTTDFGSAQASVTARVYQLSSVVGRGYVQQATV
jgi:hypothetical protein